MTTHPSAAGRLGIWALCLTACIMHPTVARAGPQSAAHDGDVVEEFADFDRRTGYRLGSGLAYAPDGNLYGTAPKGGKYSFGTVFRVNPKGHIQVLHDFAGTGDGVNPFASLAVGSDGSLYGRSMGNANSGGIIFRIATDGTFSVIHELNRDGSEGIDYYFYFASPMILGRDGAMYGNISSGGAGNGTLFKISSDGEFSVVASYLDDPSGPPLEGDDGNFYVVSTFGGDHLYGRISRASRSGNVEDRLRFHGL